MKCKLYHGIFSQGGKTYGYIGQTRGQFELERICVIPSVNGPPRLCGGIIRIETPAEDWHESCEKVSRMMVESYFGDKDKTCSRKS